jgi:hypothetical protein
MLPHSLHLLQLLDISCFTVLKRMYGRQIEGFIRTGLNYIDKPDFLTAYISARQESITPDTIRSGFAATGLVLFDPERVLSRLNTHLRTLTPPVDPSTGTPTQQAPWVPETPHDITQLELQTKAIKDYIKRRTASPPSPTDQALNQLVKGCQIAIYNTILLVEENRQLRAENARQKKKREKRRSYIAQGGVLTVQEGLNRSQIDNLEPTEGSRGQPAELRTRVPCTCSIYRSLEHTARTYS